MISEVSILSSSTLALQEAAAGGLLQSLLHALPHNHRSRTVTVSVRSCLRCTEREREREVSVDGPFD